jgi:GrpB-like predicted nucleotidyltransferase (UPF0157 family)
LRGYPGRVPIEIVDYQPSWPERFEAERLVLVQALAPWLSGGVHHIGSTSVAGLPAKPVIDMMAGVASLSTAQPAVERLASLGYQHAAHRPEALWFFKPGDRALEWRTHHLHLTEPGSDLWRERLAFRDALRADPELAAEYADLKASLSAEHGVANKEYTRDKRPFVARVLASAGINL